MKASTTCATINLQRVRQLGVIEPGATLFTDKMPLNETHMGLIALMFPEAPLVHVLRHPLDIVLSVYSNQLSHGFHCANALETIARHYVLVMDLVDHYRREMKLNYHAVRYEDIVDDQETHVRAAEICRPAVRQALPEIPREPALCQNCELRAGDGKTLSRIPLSLSPLSAPSGAGHSDAGTRDPAARLHDCRIACSGIQICPCFEAGACDGEATRHPSAKLKRLLARRYRAMASICRNVGALRSHQG